MRIREMRELTRVELEIRRRELEEERFNLQMRRSFKDLDNPLRLRHLRREIGRINTVLQEDTLGIRRLAQAKTSILADADKPKAQEK